MAKVFLVQPPLPVVALHPRGTESSASYLPPLGLAYIAAYLQKHGHECAILDGLVEPVLLEDVCRLAKAYDIVGITTGSAYAVVAIDLIKALKESGLKAPIVVGGPHVTALPRDLIDYGADYAVVGEGEETMLELVDTLTKKNKPLHDVQSIAFMENGQFIRTKRRALIENLDQIPLPARELLPMHLYRTSPARSVLQPSHSVVVSRGCPGNCSFCNKRTFGTKIRYFSVQRIVEEFILLRDTYGAKDIAVLDDNFVANKEVVAQTCEELIRRGWDLSWSVEARIDAVNEKVLQNLKKAGCTYICYGIESGSQRVLDYMNKHISKDQIRETIRMTKKVGLPIRGYYMMGLPTETLAEMEETIQFAVELDLDVATFTIFIPFPGTIEYARALKSGTFPDPEYYHHVIVPEINFQDNPLYLPEGITQKELIEVHQKAYKRYYFRPKMLMRKLLSIRSMGEFSNLVGGAMALLKDKKKK